MQSQLNVGHYQKIQNEFLNKSMDQIDRFDKDTHIFAKLYGDKMKENMVNERKNLFNYSSDILNRTRNITRHSLLHIKNGDDSDYATADQE